MNRSVIFQPHLTSASTLSGKTQKLTNCIFIQMLNYFFARHLNQLLIVLFNLDEYQFILMLLHDSKSCNQWCCWVGHKSLIMATLCNRAGPYIFVLWFLLLPFFLA